MEINEEEAKMIIEMAGDCYSEGLLTNDQLQLVIKIRKNFETLKDMNTWIG